MEAKQQTTTENPSGAANRNGRLARVDLAGVVPRYRNRKDTNCLWLSARQLVGNLGGTAKQRLRPIRDEGVFYWH